MNLLRAIGLTAAHPVIKVADGFSYYQHRHKFLTTAGELEAAWDLGNTTQKQPWQAKNSTRCLIAEKHFTSAAAQVCRRPQYAIRCHQHQGFVRTSSTA